MIPTAALAHHVAILGKTGSGKTTAAKAAAERLLDEGRRVCAIDPTGAWYGLRLAADGRAPGYPVVIFGGDHGDVPISDQSGVRAAELIANGTFSSVVDTSQMTVGERTRFFTAFAETLFRANRTPLNLIIDEAHLFAPQGRIPDPQSGRMVHATNNLVSGGRSRGLRIMLISQRPAKLHKDSLTQVETLVAMRLIAPQDRAAVEDWIGEWADPKQGREVIASLPSLPVGHGWIWSPELGMLEKVNFPPISTFDSSRAPEHGEASAAPGALCDVDIDGLRAALRDMPPAPGDGTDERAVAPSRPMAPAKAELDKAHANGFSAGYAAGFNRASDAARDALLKYAAEQLADALRQAAEKIEPPAAARIETDDKAARRAEPKQSARLAPAMVTNGNGSRAPELRILRVLASRHPARFTRAQWATLAGMKRTGGTWQTYVSRLRVAGYIDEVDGLIGVTAPGLAVVGAVQRPAGGSVIQQWKAALGGGPSKLIDVLINAQPHGMDRANLADRVGMTASGGTFQTYLSKLRSNGLIEDKGPRILASPTLFLDSAVSV